MAYRPASKLKAYGRPLPRLKVRRPAGRPASQITQGRITIPSHRPDPRASYPRASYPRASCPGASCPGARLPAASRAQDGCRQFEFVLVEKMLHGARHSSASSTLKRGFFETQKLAPLVCSPVQHQWILMTSSTMASL